MKIVSFNVNSVRLRLHQLQAVIDKHQPDVIGLQETKVDDPVFPEEQIRALGYKVSFHGQKTHYGVALMTRNPQRNIRKGFDTDTADAQRRLIAAEIDSPRGRPVTVVNGYFPQGESRDHEIKFPAKQKFYQDLHALLHKDFDPASALVVIGDFNVAPLDDDIGIGDDNRKRWLRTGKASFLPEEREWLQSLTDWGLVDSFRQKYADENNLFSWFDYRSRGFEREPRRGLRIDHLLASRPLADALGDAGIDYDIRAMEKPSDHCPVWAEYDY